MTISGVGGNTAANGTFTATVTGANTFSLNGTTGNGTYTAGSGSWNAGFTLTFNGATTAPLPSNATAAQIQTALNNLSTIGGASGWVTVTGGTSGLVTQASNTTPITITTPSTAGLVAGDQVTINDLTGDTNGNGTWTISNVTATTFQLVGSTTNGLYNNGVGATWTAAVNGVYTVTFGGAWQARTSH